MADDIKSADRDELLKRLYGGVNVKTRRYRFRSYKKCFVGSEAVDFMVESGWAKDREEAVQIGLALQKYHRLFVHCVDPDKHPFKDSYKFYRFHRRDPRKNQEISFTPDGYTSSEDDENSIDEDGYLDDPYAFKSLSTSKKVGLYCIGAILQQKMNVVWKQSVEEYCFTTQEAIDYMVSSGLASSRIDAVHIGEALQRETGCIDNVENDDKFADKRQFFFFVFDPPNQWREKLEAEVEDFVKNLKVKNHKYKFKTYRNCFTGSDAVTLLVKLGVTTSRQDAVLIGRAFMHEFQLFAHCVNEHTFEDTDLFYRFTGY
jgi:hypothetical protein